LIRSHHLLCKKNASCSLSVAATAPGGRSERLTTAARKSNAYCAATRLLQGLCAMPTPLRLAQASKTTSLRLLLRQPLRLGLGLQRLCARHIPGVPDAGPRATTDALSGGRGREERGGDRGMHCAVAGWGFSRRTTRLAARPTVPLLARPTPSCAASCLPWPAPRPEDDVDLAALLWHRRG